MEEKQEKLWNAPYIILLCLSVLTGSAFSMIQPSLASYATTLGASLTQAGLIGGIFAISALIMRPVSGAMSDRFNKKILMATSTLFTGLAAFGYMFSAKYYVLLAFRVLHGLSYAASSTVNIAFATSFVPRKRLGEGVGFLGLGSIISGSLGPNLGIYLIDHAGYQICFLVAALLQIVAAFCMMFIRYQHRRPNKAKAVSFSIHDLVSIKCLPLAVFAMVFCIGNGLITNYLKLMGAQRGIGVGIYFTVHAFVAWAIRPFSGKLNDKKGLSWVLVPSYLLEITAMTLLAIVSQTWMVAVIGVVKAMSQASGQPALQTECIRKLGKDRSGVAVSTYFIGCDVGNGIGPILAGKIAEASGYGVMYFLCGMLSVLALIAYPIYRRATGRKTELAKQEGG